MADRWSRRVSLVVMLIDDMTDKVITDAARVWIEGAAAPVRKSEGYYVFTDLTGERAVVHIQQGMYEPKIFETELLCQGEPYAMRKVRLTPGRSYRLPSGTTCVEGQAEPGSRIFLFSRDGAKGLKLLYDYKEGRSISLYHPPGMQLEGKLLRVEGKEKAQGEAFRILARENEGKYTLEQPLAHEYKKIGTTIYPIYEAEADEKGRFFLPVYRLSGASAAFCCQAVGKKIVQREIVLEKGTVGRVNLLHEEE